MTEVEEKQAMTLKTWTTPLGAELNVAGRGGPWITITGHATYKPNMTPLKIPISGAGDPGFYYRNGWRPDPRRLEQIVGRRADE